MSAPIEVHKWAIPVRGCLNCSKPFPGLPLPFIVSELYEAESGLTSCCGTSLPRGRLMYATGYWPNGDGIFVALLKRLDDPPAQEAETRTEPEREPA